MALTPSLFCQRTNMLDPFSLDLWDPFQGFPFSKEIQRGSSAMSSEPSAIANTRIERKETSKAHVFKEDLPGLKKEEVKVKEGKVLQINGERRNEMEEKNVKWHMVERSRGKFTRRFRLPENAKMDEVKAAMENGALTVTVPKEQVRKPEVKSIPIDESTGVLIFRGFGGDRTKCLVKGMQKHYQKGLIQ